MPAGAFGSAVADKATGPAWLRSGVRPGDMSANNNGSGPRSNRYSEDRFTNWSEYEPWWLEVQSVFKRFDRVQPATDIHLPVPPAFFAPLRFPLPAT